MSISQALLPEFDMEMANTRKALERVPEGKTDWQPHPKSMSLGRLAGHIAEIPRWGAFTLESDELALSSDYKPFISSVTSELLAKFDENVAASRAAIAKASDADMMKNWSLMRDGRAILKLPKIAVLRSMVMNHIIHHRGQLTVYLRMNSQPVPSLYGPSADENPMGL